MLFAKQVYNGYFWLNLLVNIYETLCIIENFICQVYDNKIGTVIFMPYQYLCWYEHIFFSDFSYTPGFTSFFVKQSLKYSENWYFSHENQGSSADKNGSSNGFNSRVKAVVMLTFIAYIDIYLSIFRQNMAIAIESAGKSDS